MMPGSWEVCAMAGLSSSIEVKARYALRFLLKGTTATLVELPRAMNWNSAKRLLDEMAGQANPLARSIHKAIGGVLSEASAGIPSHADAIFHPRLSTSERRARVVELGAWWCQVTAHMSVLDPGSRLYQKTSTRIALHLWCEPDPSAALALLNLLFDAAHRRLPMPAVRPLVQRWHIPPELKRPKDVMLELAAYLSTLHTGEVLFVQALLASALDHHDTEQRRGPYA